MRAFLTGARQNLNSFDFVFQVATDIEQNFPMLQLLTELAVPLLFNSLSLLYIQDISPL